MTHQPPPPAPRSRESASFRHRSSVEITADTTAHEAAEKFLGFLREPGRSVYEKQAYEIRGTSLFSLTVTFQVLDEEFRFARPVKLSSQGARFSLQATRRSITLKSCLVGRERSSRDHPLDLRSRDVSGDRSPRKFLRPRDLPRDFPRDFPFFGRTTHRRINGETAASFSPLPFRPTQRRSLRSTYSRNFSSLNLRFVGP